MISTEQSKNSDSNGSRSTHHVPNVLLTDSRTRKQAANLDKKYDPHRTKHDLSRPLTSNFRRSAIEDDIDDKYEEIERLSQDIIHLSTKRRMHVGQQLDWQNNHAYHNAIVPFSKAWNRDFVNKMQTYLPRELRDMVYGFVWDDTEKLKWEDTFYEVLTGSNTRRRQLCNCMKKPPTTLRPHYLNPEFLGPTTALEMVETVYRDLGSCTFWFSADLPELIKGVVCNDAFKVDFDPSYYIRSMRVECKIDRYRSYRSHHKKTDRCQHKPAERQYIKQHILRSHFADLLKIKRKDGFRLFISLVQRNIRVAVLKEVLAAIKDVVVEFRKAGAVVTVAWLYKADDIGGSDIFWDDMSGYYENPQEWQQEMMEVLAVVG